MQPWQKNYIEAKKNSLTEDTDCDTILLAELVARKVISSREKGDVEGVGKTKGAITQAGYFYDLIVKKEGAYPILIKALDKAVQSGASRTLKDGIRDKHLYEDKEEEEGEAQDEPDISTNDSQAQAPASGSIRRGIKRSNANEANDLRVKKFQQMKSESTPGPSRDFWTDEVDALKDTCVRKLIPPMNFGEKDKYKLSPGSLGHVLFLNFREYPNNTSKNRLGAEIDTHNMKKLWEGIGYKFTEKGPIINFRDGQRQLDTMLSDFKSQFKNDSGSCVVIIGSHGQVHQEYGCCILSSDFETINLYKDIIYKFDTENFPMMASKPKMFFIQACQDFPPSPRPLRDDISSFTASRMDHTIVCFSTSPGSFSNRFEELGSWYFHCLTKVFMEEAHRSSLQEMLVKTHREVTNGTVRNKLDQQTPSWLMIGGEVLEVDKLYFNMSSS